MSMLNSNSTVTILQSAQQSRKFFSKSVLKDAQHRRDIFARPQSQSPFLPSQTGLLLTTRVLNLGENTGCFAV